jgi:hypothetical protein
VSSILTITLVENGDLLYWQYAIDTSEVRKVLDDNFNSLTWDDMRALSTGGEFQMTWGYQISAFNTISTPTYHITDGVVKSDGEVCWHANSWMGARPFAYTNRTILFIDCVQNCADADDERCPEAADEVADEVSDDTTPARSADRSDLDDANGAALGARGRATWLLATTTTAAMLLAGFLVTFW